MVSVSDSLGGITNVTQAVNISEPLTSLSAKLAVVGVKLSQVGDLPQEQQIQKLNKLALYLSRID